MVFDALDFCFRKLLWHFCAQELMVLSVEQVCVRFFVVMCARMVLGVVLLFSQTSVFFFFFPASNCCAYIFNSRKR